MTMSVMQKRGISPVIASVLIVLIVLVAGAVVAYFALPYAKNIDTSCVDALNYISFEDVGFNCIASVPEDSASFSL